MITDYSANRIVQMFNAAKDLRCGFILYDRSSASNPNIMLNLYKTDIHNYFLAAMNNNRIIIAKNGYPIKTINPEDVLLIKLLDILN